MCRDHADTLVCRNSGYHDLGLDYYRQAGSPLEPPMPLVRSLDRHAQHVRVVDGCRGGHLEAGFARQLGPDLAFLVDSEAAQAHRVAEVVVRVRRGG